VSRRRVVAILAVLTAAAAAFIGVAALRGDEGVDEDEYAAQNLRLLSELPVFADARPLSTIRDRCAGPDRRARAPGFFTSRIFGLRRETSRGRLIRL
jgi:hypothetical protein